MIDFIIYEKNKNCIEKIKNDIYKFFGAKKDEFKIYNYEDYISRDESNKIYILSSSIFKETIKIAKEIRNKGDFTSTIIIISHLKDQVLANDLLVLSYIDINKKTSDDFIKSLIKAYDIIINSDTFNFIFNKIVYRIPLKDILYIEKENNSNMSIIHTKDNNYEINSTINDIEKRINCINFMKVHRSCIINITNIERYDFCDNVIYFKNDSINLISREKRQILKERLLDNKTVVKD